MELKIRRRVIFAILPLAALALTLFLLSWGDGLQKARAAVDPSVNMSISGATGFGTGTCNSNGTPAAKCSAIISDAVFLRELTVSFNLDALPSTGNYGGYILDIAYTSAHISYNAGSLQQVGAGVWPDCNPVFAAGEAGFTPGDATTTCSIGPGAPPSTYVGTLAKLTFTCNTAGTDTITLKHGDSHTSIVDANLAAHSEAADESLTINCLTGAPFGGISVDPQLPGSSGGRSGLLAGAIAGGMAAVVLGSAAWYVRRRRAQ